MVLEYSNIRKENFAVYFEIHSHHSPEQRGEYHKNPQVSVDSNTLRLETVASEILAALLRHNISDLKTKQHSGKILNQKLLQDTVVREYFE